MNQLVIIYAKNNGNICTVQNGPWNFGDIGDKYIMRRNITQPEKTDIPDPGKHQLDSFLGYSFRRS